MNCILPTEVIIHIISFLDDIEDIHNCMLLSKEIRDFIFKTPEIMRKLLINFSKCKWINIPMKRKNVWNSDSSCSQTDSLETEPQIGFLEKRGKFFRCLQIKIDENYGEILKFILNLVPNLEELNFEILEPWCEILTNLELFEETPDLKRLKNLRINHNALKFLLKNTKNVKNLQKLAIISPKVGSQEILTDFFIQQDHLKEFTLRFNTGMDIINFPTRDITKEINFKLTKLKLCFVNSNREHFIDFLKTQVEHLEELELNYKPHEDILDVVFKLFKNLSNLTLNTYGDSPVFSEFYPHWQLPNLRKYTGKSFSGMHLKNIYMRFPNVEALSVWKLMDSAEVYSKLTTLEVGLLYYHQLQHLKLPGLKDLTIVLLNGDNSESSFINLTKNIENVENMTIKDFQDDKEVTIVVKNLNSCKNLKTFKLGCLKRIGYGNAMGVNLINFKDQQFFNMIIDTKKKLIKYSRFISIRFPEIFDIFVDNFKGFDVIEYNVHKPKVLSVGGKD